MRRHYSDWEIRKYKGDTAWYAKCKCGFQYNCSILKKINGIWKTGIKELYAYCPSCGSRKRFYNESPRYIDKYVWDTFVENRII